MNDDELKLAWSDIEEQAAHAGVNASDPLFMKYAAQAPPDLDYYDQISWAINQVRAEKEAAKRRKATQPKKEAGVSISTAVDDALNSIRVR